MYFGHLTKRVRSLLGWMFPPIRGDFTTLIEDKVFFKLTDAKVPGSLLDERVHLFLWWLLGHERRSGDLLCPLYLLSGRLK